MTSFANSYRDKRVLVTGHTGFKGSWLTLWLDELGAKVSGIALTPESQPNHWDLLNLSIDDYRIDIRNINEVHQAFDQIQPEIVFHLAAQPLVRRSYANPLETWSSNVMGTANVLEACRLNHHVQAIVVVTTDKCYENHEWPWGYRENDRLGGHDPYSASKACAELIAASYRSSFFNDDSTPLLATARAGNVIGGGDWSEDRLIPDLVRSIQLKKPLVIRSPDATRPWQHVLESLRAYLLLGQQLLEGNHSVAEAWNFGPDPDGNKTVSKVLEQLGKEWDLIDWRITEKPQLHEASLLYLDSSKARSKLNCQPIWNVDTALSKTVQWYRNWLESGEIISRRQLAEFQDGISAQHTAQSSLATKTNRLASKIS